MFRHPHHLNLGQYNIHQIILTYLIKNYQYRLIYILTRDSLRKYVISVFNLNPIYKQSNLINILHLLPFLSVQQSQNLY